MAEAGSEVGGGSGTQGTVAGYESLQQRRVSQGRRQRRGASSVRTVVRQVEVSEERSAPQPCRYPRHTRRTEIII